MKDWKFRRTLAALTLRVLIQMVPPYRSIYSHLMMPLILLWSGIRFIFTQIPSMFPFGDLNLRSVSLVYIRQIATATSLKFAILRWYRCLRHNWIKVNFSFILCQVMLLFGVIGCSGISLTEI